MINIRVFGGMRLTHSVAVAALLALSPGLAQSQSSPANFFSAPTPENLVPTDAKVCPVRVISTSGSVDNAQGIVCDGMMETTITVSAGSPATIVLDYGRNVGGIPFFDVGAVSGSIQMKASYSETNRYLWENGDGAAPPAQAFGTGEGDPRRYDNYVVEKAGLITNYYNQGGQRYQLLTITGSGSVTLKQVGITYIADRTQPADYGGYFRSNDDVLNRVWYAGVYTAQLGSVPARSMPGGFRIVSGALEARGASNLTGGSDIGYYIPGKDWTDYTMTMQASIVTSQAGWVVRAQDPQNGIVFILDTKGQLRALSVVGNNYKEIGSATVPFAIKEGTWYDISTTVQGKSATVSINGSARSS
jgi:alpha-L-rhamnosidase